VLVVDDTVSIHEDFRKVFAPRQGRPMGLQALETELFGSAGLDALDGFSVEMDAVSQGAEAVELVGRSLLEGRPYAIAFVDLRMPPGWDGVETIARIRALDPRVQIVVCTAFADDSWETTASRLGGAKTVTLIEKPFVGIEVQRITRELASRWMSIGDGRREGGA
jgi:CheY-like chemotaxis protein